MHKEARVEEAKGMSRRQNKGDRDLGACALPLDGLSGAGEAELVMEDGGALHEVGVLQPLRTNGTLEVITWLRSVPASTGSAALRPGAAVATGVAVPPGRRSPPRFTCNKNQECHSPVPAAAPHPQQISGRSIVADVYTGGRDGTREGRVYRVTR